MAKTEMIHTRIEPKLKKSVEAIFSKLGMTTADAISIFFKQVEFTRGLPFDVKIPNKTTRQAVRQLRSGKGVKKYRSFEDMHEDITK